MSSSLQSSECRRGQLLADFLAGSWRQQQTPPDLSLDELEEVGGLLYNSGGTGLAWWRIHESELATSPHGELLHQGYRLQALQTPINEDRILNAFRLLRAHGIEPILVKGWAAARFYPHRTLRPYGDIDLVVQPAEYQAARAALENDKAATWWLDLHSGLIELKDRSVDGLFARAHLIALKDVQVRILSDEDHLALLAIHLFKHGAWRPSWLCDIAAICEAASEKFDWQVSLGSNRNASAWIATAVALSRQLLGANLAHAPEVLQKRKAPEWLVEAVLKQWGSLFQAGHLPVRPQRLMSDALKSPGGIMKEIRSRWPDPIVATFNLRAGPNNFPRLPYQLGAFAVQAGRYVFDYAIRNRVEVV